MHLQKLKKYLNLEYVVYFCIGIYFTTLFCTSTTFYLTITQLPVILKIIRYVCYLAFAYKSVIDWKKSKSYIILIVVIISIFIAIFSKHKEVMCTTLLLVSIRNLNKDKIMKIIFYIYAVLFFCIINLALLGFLPDWIYYRQLTERHSLGFFNPTIAIGMFFVIVLMYFYIRKQKVSIIQLFALQTLNTLLFTYTRGRMAFILSTLVILGLYLSTSVWFHTFLNNEKCKRTIKYFCYILPVCIYVFAYVIIILYSKNNTFAIEIDKLISNRVLFAYNAIKEYDISLFGIPIEWHGHGGIEYIGGEQFANVHSIYNYVDTSYVKSLLDYGWLFFSCILCCYVWLFIKCEKEKNYRMIYVLFIILIWSIIEPYIFGIEKNIFLIYFSVIFNYGRFNNYKLKKCCKSG